MPIQLFYYDFNLPGQCYSMLKNMPHHTQPFSIRFGFPVATSLQLEYHINNSKLVKLIYNNNKNLIVFYNR